MIYQFPNIGILHHKFSDEELKPIRDEIQEILNSNFNIGTTFNHGVESNIEREFALVKSKNHLESIITPKCIEYNNQFEINNAVLTDNLPLKLAAAWINFQKKYEFNPLHDHAGVYSFVIWIKIPYDINDEINLPLARNSTVKLPGHFQFAFTDIIGNIRKFNIPVDKTLENRMLFFPAKLHHVVYPFYTSEDYRISISGNFSFSAK